MKVFIPFEPMETFPQEQNSEMTCLGTTVTNAEKTKFPCPETDSQFPYAELQGRTTHVTSLMVFAPSTGKRHTLVLTKHPGRSPHLLILSDMG